MANDTISKTTPAAPLSPLRMQNDRLNLRLLSIRHLLQIINRDLQFESPTRKAKCGGIEFGRSEMAFCVVRGSDALGRSPHHVGVQFSVRMGAYCLAGPPGNVRHIVPVEVVGRTCRVKLCAAISQVFSFLTTTKV